jgi:hypothetical protein
VKLPDYVHRRVIVEYGRQYVYATLTDSAGKILDEEVWKQPYRIDPKDAADEARAVFDAVYQHITDEVVFPSPRDSARDGEESGQSE